MSEHELEDPLLVAVRKARPAIDDAVLTPTSADALKVLDRVLHGEEPAMSSASKSSRGQRSIRTRRGPVIPRILRPRFGAIAVAAAAAVAVVVIGLSGVSGAPSLVDRAFAAINAGNQVVHEVDIRNEGPPGFYERIEGWLVPATGQARVIDFSAYRRARYVSSISEWIVTANGRVFGRSCLAYCVVGPFVNGRSKWAYEGTERTLGGLGFGLAPQTLPGTFAGWFRAAYRAHAIVPDGGATFDGKHVARFQSMTPAFENRKTMVFWRPGTSPPAHILRVAEAPYVLIDWYVDSATAQPAGFTASACKGDEVRSCGRVISTTRIVTFERLDPTPQNLGLLTGPHAPAGAR